MIRYLHRLRVRYSDTDAMGIVYYSRYLEFFEAARSDMLRSLGLPYSDFEQAGYALPVVEAHCRYFRGARFDQLLIIECRIAGITAARLRIDYLVSGSESGSNLAEGYTIHAFTNQKGRPIKPPPVFTDLITTNRETQNAQ